MKEYRKLRRMTQKEVADAIGIDRSTYANIERGKPTRMVVYREIARVLNVPIQYLTSENPDPLPKIKNQIPVLGSVPAGVPIEAIEDIEEYIDIYPRFVKHGELFALRVQGDSMEPDIRQGDIAIVEKQEFAESGDLVVIRVNSEDVTLKRIKITQDGIMLIPDNKAYYPTFFSQEQINQLPVTIIGKVIEIRRRF